MAQFGLDSFVGCRLSPSPRVRANKRPLLHTGHISFLCTAQVAVEQKEY